MDAVPNAWTEAARTIRTIYGTSSPAYTELEWHLRPDDPPQGQGSGYVVDTLRSARLALQEPTYEAVVKTAIALGHDTDTTACVAGGLAGIRDGVGGIPARWLHALRGKDMVEPLLQRLLQQANV